MKTSKFFLFALILGVVGFMMVGCASPYNDKSGSGSEGDAPFLTRDGDDDMDGYSGTESVSDSDEVSLQVFTEDNADTIKVRYVMSNNKDFASYPSANNRGSLIRDMSSGSATIGSVSTRYVLCAFFSDGNSSNWDDAEYGYWEVENFSGKLDVSFSASGNNLTIAATYNSQTVTDAIVRFTTDGTDPTTSSPLFFTGSGTFTASSGVVVKAKAFASASSSYENSDVKSYTMGSSPNPPSTSMYFYVDSSWAGWSVKITFENGSVGPNGTYVVGSDGKVPCVMSGTPTISVNLISPDGKKWCDARGTEGCWSQGSSWNGNTLTLVSYQNGGMTPTGNSVPWTRR